ncbi:hypothetical protein QBC42DRAFT_327090 [Cladorrhinum samala]|uniref:CMP/dCMP-type deaminase domain-containing protein n=1 Tax=Cladorrhinum samala TaxID=585594 RepID=A0AAV9HNI0_9PEZI|nr:hypothetical protein QBC42DRAFT_327090 [Cladorrhinum samala]
MNRSDQYLGLCLEQATYSPLFNRHGAIVVKGGKVIGRGYNDYRPGFDGGALKTGQLPVSASGLDTIVEFKHRTKFKPTMGPSSRPTPTSVATFTPFENVMGSSRHCNNNCLSMHSEMMAINSALLSSTTLRPTGLSQLKPNTSRASYKIASALRRSRGKDGVLNKLHLDATRGERRDLNGNQKQNNNLPDDDTGTCPSNTGDRNSSKAHRSHGKSSKAASFKGQDIISSNSNKQSAVDFRDRIKSRKLVGADVYVVRLEKASEKAQDRAEPHDVGSVVPPTRLRSPSPGSLHDELNQTNFVAPPTAQEVRGTVLRATSSRPCYRCVAYMHNAGIKRVFWTNGEGKWEGAKVRDLVDLLNGSGSPGDGSGLGIFVTKHEILRLRRLMGA